MDRQHRKQPSQSVRCNLSVFGKKGWEKLKFWVGKSLTCNYFANESHSLTSLPILRRARTYIYVFLDTVVFVGRFSLAKTHPTTKTPNHKMSHILSCDTVRKTNVKNISVLQRGLNSLTGVSLCQGHSLIFVAQKFFLSFTNKGVIIALQ